MKITTLIENTKKDHSLLEAEHGLSFLIEDNDTLILFDTGASASYIENAKKLGISLNNLSHVCLSHGHYDHCGGIKSLIDEYNLNCSLNVHKDFFNNSDKYYLNDKDNFFSSTDSSEYRYIGIDFTKDFIANNNMSINLIKDDVCKLSDSIYIFSNFQRTVDYETINHNMKIKKDNKYITDKFSEEIVLGIDTPKGLLLIVGCSHIGILNTITTIKKRTNKPIYGVLGGTHLVEANEDRILKTIDYIKNENITLIGFSHCTGDKGIKMFKDEFKDFFVNNTGTIIEI